MESSLFITRNPQGSDGFRGWTNILIPGLFPHVWEILIIKGIYISCCTVFHLSEFPGRPRYPIPGVIKWTITETWRSASSLRGSGGCPSWNQTSQNLPITFKYVPFSGSSKWTCKQTPCICCIHSVSWNKYKEHDRCWDNIFFLFGFF